MSRVLVSVVACITAFFLGFLWGRSQLRSAFDQEGMIALTKEGFQLCMEEYRWQQKLLAPLSAVCPQYLKFYQEVGPEPFKGEAFNGWLSKAKKIPEVIKELPR